MIRLLVNFFTWNYTCFLFVVAMPRILPWSLVRPLNLKAYNNESEEKLEPTQTFRPLHYSSKYTIFSQFPSKIQLIFIFEPLHFYSCALFPENALSVCKNMSIMNVVMQYINAR